MWTGSAASAVDLNPAGSTDSIAYATNGTNQVGYDFVPGTNGQFQSHAVVWSGTAGSVLDLNALLPNQLVSSTAYSIDAAGDVYGLALDGADNYHAVEWVPSATAIPLPPAAWAAMTGLPVLLLAYRLLGGRAGRMGPGRAARGAAGESRRRCEQAGLLD